MESDHQDDPGSSFNGSQTQSGNYIWAGAMCLAWNQLKEKVIKEDIQVKTKNHRVTELVDNFNVSKFKKDDLKVDCYYVKAGLGNQTVKAINKEVKGKFSDKTTEPLKENLKDTSIIAYAYFLKDLKFKYPFQKCSKDLRFKNVGEVPAFFAKNKPHRSQVKIHNYSNQHKFMIQLGTVEAEQQLILFKTQQDHNIDSILEQFKARRKENPESMKQIDMFIAPNVLIDLKRSYNELIGVNLQNKKFASFFFEEVSEIIKFKLDEKGARVENQAVMRLKKSKKAIVNDTPKMLILDSPFWIIMNEKGKHPYFVARIVNPTK